MAKLVRTLKGYAGCSPNAIASGSKAQMMYFIEDAKKDIATLAAENKQLREALLSAVHYVTREVKSAQQRGDVTMEDILVPEMIAAALSTPSPAVVSVTAEGDSNG